MQQSGRSGSYEGHLRRGDCAGAVRREWDVAVDVGSCDRVRGERVTKETEWMRCRWRVVNVLATRARRAPCTTL